MNATGGTRHSPYYLSRQQRERGTAPALLARLREQIGGFAGAGVKAGRQLQDVTAGGWKPDWQALAAGKANATRTEAERRGGLPADILPLPWHAPLRPARYLAVQTPLWTSEYWLISRKQAGAWIRPDRASIA